MKSASAIICVYNEEKTIRDVVITACGYSFNEVIVVNDGSTDRTDMLLRAMLHDFSFEYIVLPENKGKGYAMARGVENASNEIIVFIDADLSYLRDDHLFELLSPIKHNEADMVLGQPTETLIDYGLNPFKSFSGQRALLKKDILPLVDDMKNSRFGVETLINLYYQSKGKTVKYVILYGLKHPTKFEKVSKQQAMMEFIKEGHQIALTVFRNFDLVTSSMKNTINRNFKI